VQKMQPEGPVAPQTNQVGNGPCPISLKALDSAEAARGNGNAVGEKAFASAWEEAVSCLRAPAAEKSIQRGGIGPDREGKREGEKTDTDGASIVHAESEEVGRWYSNRKGRTSAVSAQ